MRTFVLYGGLLIALIGCAQGDGDTSRADASALDSGGFADSGNADGPTSPPVDARPLGDSLPSGDAGNFMCSTGADCVVSGECCFSAGGPGLCVKGTEIQGICLPD